MHVCDAKKWRAGRAPDSLWLLTVYPAGKRSPAPLMIAQVRRESKSRTSRNPGEVQDVVDSQWEHLTIIKEERRT